MIFLFFLSAATLLFEIILTRIFSIALWSHYAFLVVSLSLLGFGASGSVLHFVWARRFFRSSFLLFFISAVVVYFIISRVPFDPVKIAWDPWQFFWLSLFYLFASVPFFFSGLYVGSRLLASPEKSPRIYAVNSIGSAVGAFLSLFFLSLVPLKDIRISPYKPLPQALLFPDAALLETHWGPEARVDLVRSGAVRFAPGLSLQFSGNLPDQLGMSLDGDRLNAVTQFDGDLAKLSFLSYLPSAAAYTLLSKPDVLVVESGGGLDLLEALSHDSRSIVALERNENLVRMIDRDWGSFSGHLYSHPKIKMVASHVRRFLAESEDAFDLIVLTLSESPGAASTGLYGLNENYTFTVEAFRSLLDHLRPEGYVTVTRYLLPPPREEPRTLNLAIASLRTLGISDPFSHLAVIESYGTWTLLMKKGRLEVKDRAALQGFCDRNNFKLLTNLENLIPPNSPFDFSPTTDDKPFFFHFYRLSKVKETYQLLRGKWEAFFEGGYLVYAALVQAMFWGLMLILAPVVVQRRSVGATRRGRPEGDRHGDLSLRICFYFFSIGLAFMFVEMTFLQKAVFLFGHPTYGFAILLAVLLVFSGLGSLTGQRWGRRPLLLFLAIAGWTLFSVVVEDTIISALGGLPLFYLMGIPFPSALSRLQSREVPLAWAVNGVASVIGSILAVTLALEWGYSRTLMAAGILYLFSFFLFPPPLSSGQTEHR